MKQAIRFGIIGIGMISQWHINGIRNSADALLCGVADVNTQRAKDVAEKEGIRAFESVDALLESNEIDAVCICTPSGTHAPLALKALRAGKHVLIEKPLGLNVEQCNEIIKEAEAHGCRAGVVSQMRFSENILKLKKYIDEGALGRILLSELSMAYARDEEYYTAVPWHGTQKMDGGGALMNQGIHGVDTLLFLMGEATQVWGRCATRVHHIECEDNAAATIQFASGAMGVLTASTAAQPGFPRRLSIYGEKGGVTLTEDTVTDWSVKDVPSPFGETVNVGNGGSNRPTAISFEGHRAQISDFTAAILNERDPAVTLQNGRKAVQLITAIYESAQTGNAIILEK